MNRENIKIKELIDKLARNHTLSRDEYRYIIANATAEDVDYLAKLAVKEKEKHYSNKIYIRGLIEISNICKNDCFYCGIRRSNNNCARYRLKEEEILECCEEGYSLGFRTFVLQGGEDGYYTDEVLEKLITTIKSKWPDCAVTLSLGERSYDSYERLRRAGADRYLLRHETCEKNHYEKLHPEGMSFDERMRCLNYLKQCGYQVGCGFMVGSPHQTIDILADELKFIEDFKPDMCGIGPFIPHKDTSYKNMSAGSVELTCMLLSMIRLIHPKILLPATTALGSLMEDGREKGILAGANVVMPNLSPMSVRSKYMLYDNKLSDGAESAQAKDTLVKRLEIIGCKVVVDRGDINLA